VSEKKIDLIELYTRVLGEEVKATLANFIIAQ